MEKKLEYDRRDIRAFSILSEKFDVMMEVTYDDTYRSPSSMQCLFHGPDYEDIGTKEEWDFLSEITYQIEGYAIRTAKELAHMVERSVMDYSSRESAVDFLANNDYEFLEDGRMWSFDKFEVGKRRNHPRVVTWETRKEWQKVRALRIR
jgi:hypothetical protein